MPRTPFILAALAMIAVTPAAAADFPPGKDIRTGSSFLKTCGDPFAREDWKTLCLGYVIGVENAFNVASWADERLALCTAKVTYNEMSKVLVRYLKAHPDILDDPTPMSFWAAISEAYPCKPAPQSAEPAPEHRSEYRF